MPTMTAYKNGVPCWTDLGSPDRAASIDFYSNLFGWEVGDLGGDDVNGYTIFMSGGQPVAAVAHQQEEQKKMGVPPSWSTYIAVDDADATTAKAKEAGATILAEPFDVMEFGRMSVIQDPTGAVFETWQAKNMPGAALVNEPVSMAWNEVNTKDGDAAKDFYGKVFGWEYDALPDSPMEYYGVKNDGDLVGGMAVHGEDGQAPPMWLGYFAVEDADATIAKAEELGGKLMMPAVDIPAGRFAIVIDPVGAAFAVIKLNPMP